MSEADRRIADGADKPDTADTAADAVAGGDRGPGEIVVGVDGSEHSEAALRWAANYARLTGARLHVVSSWSLTVGTTAWGVPELPPPDYNPERTTRQATEAFIADVLGAAPADMALSVISGPAGSVLTDAARDADMLVLGSHGHGTIRNRLLGSTTEHCIHHATCPVLVLRTRPE